MLGLSPGSPAILLRLMARKLVMVAPDVVMVAPSICVLPPSDESLNIVYSPVSLGWVTVASDAGC